VPSVPIPAAIPSAVTAPIIPEEVVAAETAEVIPEPEPETALPIDEPVEASALFAPEELPPPDEPTESEAPVASETAPEPLTKRCSSCQAELPIEAVFCPDCGARQQIS